MGDVYDGVFFHLAIAIGPALDLHYQIRRSDEIVVTGNGIPSLPHSNSDVGRTGIVSWRETVRHLDTEPPEILVQDWHEDFTNELLQVDMPLLRTTHLNQFSERELVRELADRLRKREELLDGRPLGGRAGTGRLMVPGGSPAACIIT